MRFLKLEQDFIELKCFNSSSSKHWKLISNIENGNSVKYHQPPTITLPDSTKTEVPIKISNIFAEHLEKVFSDDDLLNLENSEIPTETNSQVCHITQKEMLDSLSQLNTKAACGFDGISNKVLKNLPKKIINLIQNIFNASIKIGYVPYE
ncbi:unnamed protein product [Brachionus calyciflorus]|uniref:Uncharacterized protein n=1 Tax=Brachionus calyciflorus TaxID=104777 RepID=A0A813Q075_9BILA|nr:unnamed protein product [Brachionus calyciflorus]